MAEKTIAVAGSTGFVGRHVVRELLGRGWAVRALARDIEKAGDVLDTPNAGDSLHVVTGDAFDRGALARLCEGADALVNCVGIIRETGGGQTFERMHVRTTGRLIEACKGAGVDRFVHISALGVRDEAPTPYYRSKFEAEMLLRASGLGWTILRPSMILGDGSEFLRMARGWITGKETPHLFVPYFRRHVGGPPIPVLAKMEDAKVQPVAVEDVATAVVESLVREGAIGELYHLVGPETMTMPEILAKIKDSTPLAKDLPMVPVPHSAAAGIAKVAKALGLRDALPFDYGMAIMASEDSVARQEKVRDDLDLETRKVTVT